MSAERSFFQLRDDRLVLRVRVTPKAARDAVEGVGEAADGSLHINARVRAVPEGGKANKALETLLAEWVGVAANRVSVTAGTTARLKTIAIAGEAGALAARVKERVGQTA